MSSIGAENNSSTRTGVSFAAGSAISARRSGVSFARVGDTCSGTNGGGCSAAGITSTHRIGLRSANGRGNWSGGVSASNQPAGS